MEPPIISTSNCALLASSSATRRSYVTIFSRRSFLSSLASSNTLVPEAIAIQSPSSMNWLAAAASRRFSSYSYCCTAAGTARPLPDGSWTVYRRGSFESSRGKLFYIPANGRAGYIEFDHIGHEPYVHIVCMRGSYLKIASICLHFRFRK